MRGSEGGGEAPCNVEVGKREVVPRERREGEEKRKRREREGGDGPRFGARTVGGDSRECERSE
eukprot:scaffold19682_cov28-Tisochrysis_lutea.AAC.1